METQTNGQTGTAIAVQERRSTMTIARETRANFRGLQIENAEQAVNVATLMSQCDIAVPPHLRGNKAACFAIVCKAMRWGFDPFAVAEQSYEVANRSGVKSLSYGAQIITAAINTLAPIRGRLKYRWDGEGQNMTCTASATFVGEEKPAEYTSPPIRLIDPQRSPLWKSDPRRQLAYWTGRAWARVHCAEVILGVYDPDEAYARHEEPATDRQAVFDDDIEELPDGRITRNGEEIALQGDTEPVDARFEPEAITLPADPENAPAGSVGAPGAIVVDSDDVAENLDPPWAGIPPTWELLEFTGRMDPDLVVKPSDVPLELYLEFREDVKDRASLIEAMQRWEKRIDAIPPNEFPNTRKAIEAVCSMFLDRYPAKGRKR